MNTLAEFLVDREERTVFPCGEQKFCSMRSFLPPVSKLKSCLTAAELQIDRLDLAKLTNQMDHFSIKLLRKAIENSGLSETCSINQKL